MMRLNRALVIGIFVVGVMSILSVLRIAGNSAPEEPPTNWRAYIDATFEKVCKVNSSSKVDEVNSSSKADEVKCHDGREMRCRGPVGVMPTSPAVPFWDASAAVKEKRPGSRGVYMLVYSSEDHVIYRYAAEAYQALVRVREIDHRVGIAVALPGDWIDNAPEKHKNLRDKLVDIADVVVRIRSDHLIGGKDDRGDGYKRQWFTRLIYLAHSPFETTLALDSNVWACRSIADVLDTVGRYDFDFAIQLSKSPKKLQSHNWVLLYRWTQATREIFADWLITQIGFGVNIDDQRPLSIALRRAVTRGARVMKISNLFAVAFAHPSDSKLYPRISRPLSPGVLPPTILHLSPSHCNEHTTGNGSRIPCCSRFADLRKNGGGSFMLDKGERFNLDERNSVHSLSNCTERISSTCESFSLDEMAISDDTPLATVAWEWEGK